MVEQIKKSLGIKDDKIEGLEIILIYLVLIFLLPIAIGFIVGIKISRGKNLSKFNKSIKNRCILSFFLLLLTALIFCFIYFYLKNINPIFQAYYLLCPFLLAFSMTYLGDMLISNSKEDDLTSELLEKNLDMGEIEAFKSDPDYIYMGMSYSKETPIKIPISRRNEHLMITGRPGAGKTSSALNIMRQDIFWKRPVIFIDPKGDKGDHDKIKKYCKMYGREDDLIIWSITDKKSSVYDILKYGDSHAVAAKISEACNLNHEHYGAVAIMFIEFFASLFIAQGKRMNMEDLFKIVLDEEYRKELISSVDNVVKHNNFSKDLIAKAKNISSYKASEIQGLAANISALLNENFKDRIIPNDKKDTISLEDVISKGKILVIDLNSALNTKLAHTFARFFLTDLRYITNGLQKQELQHNHDYIAIYMDEFDKFATPDFHDYISMARSAKISLNFMFQTIGGLKKISPEMEASLTTNTSYALHLYARHSEDVNYVLDHVTTIDKKKQSTQIDNRNLINNQTGMANEADVEKLKISAQTFHKLKVFQGVFVGENIDLIHACEYFEALKEQSFELENHNCSFKNWPFTKPINIETHLFWSEVHKKPIRNPLEW